MKLVTDDGQEILIENIKILDVPKDGVIIVKINHSISDQQVDIMREQLKRLFPNNHSLIIPDDMQLEVMEAKS
jgi:hypothetical protein